ncbi:MAG: NIPSNAP family protein [Chloroflexota bacterium]|nr:NIPSNAP family protein [Chloroflexota bacterium]
MFFELRRYPIKPGKAAEWVKLMDEVIIPYQLSKGMTVLASFVNESGDTYVWIRRFATQEERDALYDAVYQTAYWQDQLSPIVGELIDRERIEVTILAATPGSFMQ